MIQIAFEVGCHLNVHGWRDGCYHTAERIVSLRDETGEDVVFVGCQQQFFNRKPHALGNITGKDVAEITGRNRKTDRLMPGIRYP